MYSPSGYEQTKRLRSAQIIPFRPPDRRTSTGSAHRDEGDPPLRAKIAAFIVMVVLVGTGWWVVYQLMSGPIRGYYDTYCRGPSAQYEGFGQSSCR